MKNRYEIYDQLPQRFNLAGYLLGEMSEDQAERVAFYSEKSNMTYGELTQLVKKFAELLATFNLSQEDRVVILLPDSFEFTYGFLGIIWFGAVAVLVNEAYSDEDILYILDDSRAKLILTNKHWKNKLKEKASTKHRWLAVDEDTYQQQIEQQLGMALPQSVAREEAAFWVYTSGSTGRPKGVIHAHFNPIVASENYGKHVLNLNSRDIIYSAAPMAFSYGLGATVYMPLYFKASAILVSKKNPFTYIEMINKFKPTVFFGIPHTYASIYALHEIAPLDSMSLRMCITAAEQLPVSLWQKWKDTYGLSLCEGIGTTESTHIFISNSQNISKPGSTGKAVPGYTVRLVDQHGQEVSTGEVGFLEVSGEGFMLNYWNKLKETQRVLSGQTMLTGDLYQCDADKNFYFIGRKDSLVKIKGMWILPIEIENAFLEHEAVLEAAVTVEKGVLEDTVDIVAYVTLKESRSSSAELLNELNSHMKNKLPRFKIPRKIHFIQFLPRTATGKVHKKLLENMHYASM